MENLELVITVHVKPEEPITLEQKNGDSVVMIPFSGHVTGLLFEGTIEKGGVDTQVIAEGGKKHTLSARYMISGADHTGEAGKLYIENNGYIHEPSEQFIFRTYPKIITTCHSIKHLERDILIAEGIAVENGVKINIYRVL